jgi:hypothetical protein
MRELASSLRVRDLDLRTPLVVAAVVYARGCFYRGDLVSEHVPDSADLAAYLFRREVNGSAASSAPDRARALAATGRLIRDLAEKGVSHADLNAKNVLLTWPDDCNDPLLHILDLDRCRIRRSPLRDGGVSLLARLVRSLRKLGAASGHPLNETEWSALHAAFQEQP